MSTTNELFTRWKAAKGIQSDREAAARLGVSHGAPHHWRQGRNAGVTVLERMAKDLGEDAVPYYLAAMAEASKDAEDKRTLARMAKKLAASSLALLLALMPYFAPTPAAASGLAQQRLEGLYIMRTLAVRIILGVIARLWPSLRVRPPRLQPHDMEPVTCNRHALCPSSP